MTDTRDDTGVETAGTRTMTDAETAVAREEWLRRASDTGTGFPCEEEGCGLDGTNVTHDPPWFRVGNSYYEQFPDTPYHPFRGTVGPYPPVRSKPRPIRRPFVASARTEYERGYQAGYHAVMRAVARAAETPR